MSNGAGLLAFSIFHSSTVHAAKNAVKGDQVSQYDLAFEGGATYTRGLSRVEGDECQHLIATRGYTDTHKNARARLPAGHGNHAADVQASASTRLPSLALSLTLLLSFLASCFSTAWKADGIAATSSLTAAETILLCRSFWLSSLRSSSGSQYKADVPLTLSAATMGRSTHLSRRRTTHLSNMLSPTHLVIR